MTLFGQISFFDQRPLLSIGERLADFDEMMRRNNDNIYANTRVAIPASVVSYNSEKNTIVAQPLIRDKVIDRSTGQTQFVTLPQILDVPVQFPQAGNFILTMPIQAGDEVLLLFCDLPIDAWWVSGDIQNWFDKRRHDLSDAIAIPGINSVPNVVSDISANAAELRTKDGATKISIQDDVISASTGDGSLLMNATEARLEFGNASLILTNTTATLFLGSNYIQVHALGVSINGYDFLGHTHLGVTPGPGTTGPVVP